MTLRLERVRRQGPFRVMLWPLEVRPDCACFEEMRARPRPQFFVCKEPRNESALLESARRALEAARQNEVTILVLPELAFTPAMLVQTQRWLSGGGLDASPVLTLVGLCHAPLNDMDAKEADLHINEAVLLGPDGRELLRHRKLTRYSEGQAEEACSERTKIGDTLQVLETPIGNLAILICLDLHAEHSETRVEASHANLLLSPSLSSSVSAHENAAQSLLASQLAGTFVCNWTPPGCERRAAPSLYRVPRKVASLERHDPDGGPYLLFSLDS